MTDHERQVLHDLAFFLQEAHQSEIDNDHGGDTDGFCSYCHAIAEAEKLLK